MAEDVPAIVLASGLSADQAAARARDDADLDEAPAPTALSALVRGRPMVAIGATLEPCAGEPTTAATVAAGTKRARGRLDYLDPAQTRAEVAAALRLAACAADAIDPTALGRLYYLDGVAAYALNDHAAAADAFARVRQVAPAFGWDDTLQADARPLFDAATPGPLVATLRPVPARGDRVLIDGRPASDAMPMPAGRHLVQVLGATGAWVEFGDGDVTVVIPAAVDDDAVRWIDDEAGAGRLASVIAAVTSPGTDVYLATPEQTWRCTSGDTGWTKLATHRVGLNPLGPVLGAGGLLAVGSGVVMFASANQRAWDAWDAGDRSKGATWTEYSVQKPVYDDAMRDMRLAGAIGAVGAAGLSAGVVVTFGRSR